jgi:hypothetical protein
VFQWHARFTTGRKSVGNDEHTGRHTSCTTHETVARIEELIRQDRRRTIHDIAEEVGIGYATCQWALPKELGMHCVSAKFVPRILTADRSSTSSMSALNFFSPPPTMKHSCPGSQLVMRAGFTVTALRQSNNHSNGKARHQGQKRPDS